MNTSFQIQEMNISDVKLITPFYMEDNRGYFLKSVEKDVFKEWGINIDIYEDFETYSKKNVIRGMHFQTQNPQDKLVRTIRGVIHDVVVDLRRNSITFGQYVDVVLSEDNHSSLWVPAGFAHGFEVLSEDAIMSYKCVGKYMAGYDTGICWNDTDLNIQWQTKTPIVSDKDAALMSFREFREKYVGL